MEKKYKIKSSSGDLVSYYSEGENHLPSEIIQNINNVVKNGIIKNHYRLNILNPDETVRSVIPEDDIIIGGGFQENYQNGQRRSLSISLFNETGKYTPSINGLWANTKFSYDVGVELLDGEVTWFKKGVYIISSIAPSHEPQQKNVSIELSDKFAIFESGSGILEMSYTIPVGTDVEQAIKDILNQPDGTGDVLDPKPIIYHSSLKGKKTQVTISKEIGANFGDILSELCMQINSEYFYDVDGNLNIIPLSDVTNDSDKPIIDSLFAEKGDFVADNLSFDFSDVVNRIRVIGATVDGRSYQATAVNDNIASPLCYQRIGYRTASPISDSNITSDILAQERADYELRNKLILKSTVSIETPLNPYYLVNNIIELTDDFWGFKQEKFIIQSISYSLDYSGFMTVGLANLQNLPFFTERRG